VPGIIRRKRLTTNVLDANKCHSPDGLQSLQSRSAALRLPADVPGIILTLHTTGECLKDMTVMDIGTNPKNTPLLQNAEAQGCKVVYGERMLLWQGVYKFKLFTSVEPPVEVMEQAMASK